MTALALCVPVQAQTPFVDALRALAEAGDAQARFDLGIAYDIGEGVPEDDAEAVRWFRLAADQGHARAQFNLGFMYANGAGVPQDYVLAYMWFNLAASRMTGEVRALTVEQRDQAADELTPDALNEAQRLAWEWDAAHPA